MPFDGNASTYAETGKEHLRFRQVILEDIGRLLIREAGVGDDRFRPACRVRLKVGDEQRGFAILADNAEAGATGKGRRPSLNTADMAKRVCDTVRAG